MFDAYQPRVAPEEVPEGPVRKGPRRFRIRRAEARAGMARMSWSEFWRDLGIRFLVAGGIVVVVAALIWLVGR